MIVVDTNVLAYLYLPSEFTPLAEKLLSTDAQWAAPILWRSEFRNVLAAYLRRKQMTLEQAYAVQRQADSLLAPNQYEIDSWQVLQLVSQSDCSAYDCEYVALAQSLGVKLVTQDKQLLRAFPDVAYSLNQIAH